MRNITTLLITAAAFACAADEPNAARRHPFDGFTRPYRTIQVAAGDFGRVATVDVKPGERISTGERLLKLDTSVLEVSRLRAKINAESTAKVRSYSIELKLAERKLANLKSLSEATGASPEEIQRADADVQIAKANLDEARQKQEELQLALEEIEARISAREVRSPIDGIVTDVHYESGEYVPASAPDVATVVDLKWLRTTLFLPTLEALKLQPKTVLKLQLVETNQNVDAVVERVSKVTQANSGRVRVELVIDNSDGKYRSGLRSRLVQKSLEQAFLSPHFKRLPNTQIARLQPLNLSPGLPPERSLEIPKLPTSRIVIAPARSTKN